MISATVPTYNLYGHTSDWSTPGPLHCETIRARSSLHNWEIKPHRHERLHQILFLEAGIGRAVIDGNPHDITGPALIYVAPMTIHGFSFEDGAKGYVITVQQFGLSDGLESVMSALLPKRPAIILRQDTFEAETKSLSYAFEQLYSEFNQGRAGRQVAIESYVSLILLTLFRGKEGGPKLRAAAMSTREVAAVEFKRLIDLHYSEHKSVVFYADSLGVTPFKLGGICKAVFNTSPQGVIHGRLILEAKRNLQYTTLSVAEIAHVLGFKDVSYFARFFKRMTGDTPGLYRKRAFDP